MSWPTMSDYQEVIQNAKNCFSDTSLKAGSAALNALGLPQPVTGGFCSVYKVTSGKTRWAVRCFLHDIQDLRDRYGKISGYLRKNRPRHMVGFEYLTEGIRVRGDWHPVLKMEWVDGDTLDVWIEKHVRDPRALRRLAEGWSELMKGLEKAHIGHCDLQHGNVLVDDSGALRLIDYDGMYVPPLKGRGSHEKGHPAYQHPQREGEDFDESVDRFPALVIQTSILAVAESPELWKKYYEGDNLIFRRSDFQSPDASPVFKDLAKLSGAAGEHAHALRDACKQRLGKCPQLHDVKLGRSGSAAAADDELAVPAAGEAKPNARKEPAPKKAAAKQHAKPADANPDANGASAISKLFGMLSRPKPAPAEAVAVAPSAKPARVAPQAPAPLAAPVKLPAAVSPSQQQPVKTPVTTPAPAPIATPAAARAPVVAPASAVARAVARAASAPASAPPAATPGSGWTVEWTRPGDIQETHIWQLPEYALREVPRRFLGLTLGTKKEKYVERYDEKVEERTTGIGGHHASVTALAFTHDARLLVSGSQDGSLRVWNVLAGREACAHLELHSPVMAMALAPERPLVAAVLADRRLVLWDFGPRRQVIHLRAPDRSALRAVAISNDSRWVAAGGSRRSIYTWQSERGAAGDEIRNTTGRIETLAFTQDASGLVCGTHKGRLELFNRGSSGAQWSIRTGIGRLVKLAVPPRGNGIMGAAAEGTVASWGVSDGSEISRSRPLLGRLTSFAVTPDASQLLVGLASGQACVSETGTGRELGFLDGQEGAVTAAALAATGKAAATGAPDGRVRLWSVR